jgi:DNA repair protein RecN (Recombination protein N)
MIEELRIRGLGVIDEAAVPFAPGLTVLTGETGAGKTMVLTGLGLIRGEKADPGLVRTGADRADVDGVWRLPADRVAEIQAALDEVGGSCEQDGDEWAVVLGRSVASAGRSRAFAGGRSVPAGTLAEVSDLLIAVHGQSDQLTLRDQRRQRDLLDMFGGSGLLDLRGAFAADYEDWRAAERELRRLVEERGELEREAVLLRHGIDEIAAVEPAAGEDDALKAQAMVLAHATDLLEAVSQAHVLLSGGEDETGDGAAGAVSRARRSLEQAAGLDEHLTPLVDRLDDLAEAVALVVAELSEYARGLEVDPARLQEVEERRQAIGALKRRYGPQLDDVLSWWSAAQRTVAEVDGADERRAELTAAVADLRTRVCARAAELTSARAEAATRFGACVTAELHDLAMPDAQLSVDIVTSSEPEGFTPEGADTVTMLLTPHRGGEPRPLGKGASGGELSRIMLAIEVVLAGVHRVPTFVFDEVDAGIGGRVAVEVGRRLARLSRNSQVIVVTHLPQVAAFADQHVVVTKDGSGSVTESSVVVVDGPDRVRELVRMLSGLEDSESGAEHAAELLAVAEADRGAR